MKKKRGDQKLIIKIMLLVIVIVLGVLYKVSSSTIIEDQLEGVENQVATTLYKENQGAGGNGGSGGSGSVIPGGGDSENNGSENGGSQSVDKTTVQELPNYATKLDPDGATASLTTKTVVGQDLDSLKNALVSNNVLSESEASNIDGIVVITGDVSNVGSLEIDTGKYCSSGETVAVVTYDETKKTYSYVGKATVGSDGKVTVDVNGGSSKTEFATKDENGSIVAGVSKTAGLYDANGVMLCSWEESGIDVEMDYSVASDDANCYAIVTTSPYYVLTNNYPTATKVVIPDSVTRIGANTLRNTMLTDVVIPDSVTSIGVNAFLYCTSLTDVTIPEGITSIGTGAFFKCSNLTNVTIPSSVSSIGDSAFYGCTSLISMTIGNGVTIIGEWAFQNCTSLADVTIPNSVTNIGSHAFLGVPHITYNGIAKGSPWGATSMN